MSKKLAIKGHSTRGNEVIEILEMMGGKNIHKLDGEANAYSYYLFDYAILSDRLSIIEDDDFEIFTLEAFSEKFPFKVGDKVHIYVQNDDIDGRCDIEAAEITSMRWNPTIRKIAYKMKNINREFYKEEIKCKVDDSNKQTRVMGKKLAIVGHATRGREVIEVLKMLGGNEGLSDTGLRLGGTEVCCVYHIGTGGSIIYSHHSIVNDDFTVFTLEEFLDTYPYKIGDKVIDLKSHKIAEVYKMHWSENNNRVYYDIKYLNNYGCQRRLMDLKPVDDNHSESSKMKSVLAELLEHIKTTPKEELEREFEEIKEWSNVGPAVEEFRTFCECVNKKSVYPTTFEECLNLLYCKSILRTIIGHKAELLLNLEKLLICRDAYWKIAGEEMGLDKPWKPDWCNEDKLKYCIECSYGTIDKTVEFVWNCILSFPTEEMRDAFYENFKDLIERCKELL